MANTREEVLNTVVASMLSKYDSIEAAPEQREGPEAIDITVRHDNARNTEVVIEAKIGTSAGKKREAAKQVRQRLESRPSAMAFAVCYPNDLKSLASLSQLETGMANTQQLCFAHVTRVGKTPTWREGSVQEFASVLFQNDLPQSNVADAIEYSVRQAADLISDRTLFGPVQAEKLPPLLAEALALPSKTPKDKRAAVLIAALMVSNAALLHHRLRVVDNLLDVPTLQNCMDRGDDTFLRALIDAWKAILKIDYHPVFDPAVSVLETFMAVDHNARIGAVHAVRLLVKYALAHADDLAALRFDHAGPLYHRLLESARYDGSFYTNNVSALLLADMVNQGKISGAWGRECEWPWERMRDGNWQAALFYDEELAEAYYDLAALNGTRLQIAGNACAIEPEGRRVRDAFSRNSKLDTPWKMLVLWDHQTGVHTTMAAKADVAATPKPEKEKYARSLVKKASRLVISARLYTYAVRTAACYTEEPVLGSAWVPVTSLSTIPHFEHALCAWWNSTPGILTLLHARSKKLTYPVYSLDLLRKLLIPNPRNVDVSPLVKVFAKTRQQVLKPWKEMDTCPVRARIDEAAAQVLHMDGAKIAYWRKRITLEPTVSNRPAVARFG